MDGPRDIFLHRALAPMLRAMAESFLPDTLPASKADRYAALGEEIAAVLAGEPHPVARMATVAAMLAQAFPNFFWTGFYCVDPARPRELVVGPYQGTLGCLRIAFGRGVCGTAAARGETVIVPDVAAYPGHIACDSRSRSEIVVPVFDVGGDLIAVLDVDSVDLDSFDEADAAGLEAILKATFATGA
jgi:GAF domain-containing protein